MAVGKEIKVVLTLDDAGFSTKTKIARESVAALNLDLTEIGKSAAKFESGISSLAKMVGTLPDSLKQVEKSVSGAALEMGRFTDQLSKILGNTRSAVGGIKELDSATEASAKVAKNSATTSIDARIKQVAAEKAAAAELLATRLNVYRDLEKAESAFNTRAMAASLEAERLRRTKKAGAYGSAKLSDSEADRYNTSAGTIRTELNALDALIPKMKTELELRDADIAALRLERTAALEAAEAKKTLSSISDYVGKKNAEEVKRITQQRVTDNKTADREIVESDRQAHAARMANMRSLAAEERASAQQTIALFKSMGQLYGAAKIEKGLAGSVSQADQMERQKIAVGALNLGAEAEAGIFGGAEADAKNLKFISQLDAIKSRMSAIASIGKNDKEMIDATLPTMIKAANNLEALGFANGDMQSEIRNLYGIVEMRQLTSDAQRTNDTTNLMQKIIVGTQGKVQATDMETAIRRIGVGANQLSDNGFINVAGLVDQFKVSGGGQGGAGGGASQVGTLIKMLQAYASGKTISNKAVEEFSGAGLLNEEMIKSTDYKKAFKEAKNVGFGDAETWMKDPTTAAQKMYPSILEYVKKNRAQFVEANKNVEDPEVQLSMITKYFQKLGMQQTAITGFMTMAAPNSAKRLGDQNRTITNTETVDQVNDRLQKTYHRNLEEVQAQLKDIGVMVGNTLLPALKLILGAVQNVLSEFQRFGKDNPMTLQLLTVAAAATAAILAFKGFAGLFAGVSSFGALLTALIAPAVGATAAVAEIATGAAIASTGFMGAGARIIAMAAAIGKGMLRMIPIIGQIALAYTLVDMLANMKIGGTRIIDWVIGFCDQMFTSFEIGWLRIRQLFGDQVAGLQADAVKAALNARLIANGLKEETKKTSAETQALIDQIPRDAIPVNRIPTNSPGSNPEVNFQADQEKVRQQRQANAAMQEKIKLAKEAKDLQKKLEDQKVRELVGVQSSAHSPGHFDGGMPEKNARPEFDPLNKALEEAQGKVNSQATKLKALINDAETLNDLKQQAIDEVEGKRKAGDYDEGRDKNKRPAADSKKIKDLQEVIFQEKLQTEQVKALEFANERLAAASVEANDAMGRLTDDSATKQTDAFRALERELVRAESRLGAGAKAFKAWNAAKNEAMFERTRADVGNFAADMIDTNRAEAATFLPTDKERTSAGLNASDKKQRDAYQIRIDQLAQQRDFAIKSIKETLAADESAGDARIRLEKNTAERILKINQEFAETTRATDVRQTEQLTLQAEKRARALEQPIVALALQWRDTQKELEGMQQGWANGFVSMLTNSMTTGRLEIGKFFKSILMDIATAKLKETLANPLKDIIGAGTDGLMKTLFGKNGPGADATSAVTSAAAQNAKEIAKMGAKAVAAGSSLESMAVGGVADAAKATAESAIAAIKDTSVTGLFTSALTQATGAVASFAAALGGGAGAGGAGGLGSLGGLFGNAAGDAVGSVADSSAADILGSVMVAANGGILGEYGSVSLRKYAAGGVATSPQLALYGEAGPEAYVPLPDGRSIPVTMKGGASQMPSVIVNVINQTGQQQQAQQGQPRFDGKQMILDVVLTAAGQPGSFRDGLKGAIGQ